MRRVAEPRFVPYKRTQAAASGNSVRGIKVCEELSSRFGLHAFELGFAGDKLADQFRLRKAR